MQWKSVRFVSLTVMCLDVNINQSMNTTLSVLLQVILDGNSGRSRGFAFVYYEDIADATEARKEMNGTELDGRKIRVDFSITKRPHTPTPGTYQVNPVLATPNPPRV